MEAGEKVCPRCAETVKAAAVVCKHCSYNFASKGKVAFIVGAVAIGVLALSLVFGNLSGGSSGSAVQADTSAAPAVPAADSASEAPSAAPPDIQITAKKLDAAYHANEPAAQTKYGAGPLEVSGVVNSIALDFENKPYLELGGENMFLGPQAHLIDSDRNKASTLSKGQSVTVRCASASMLATMVMLADCSLE
jgi:hypothetical protein